MPRIKGKATKIAYALIGVPESMKSKRNKTRQRINQELIARETRRVR